MGERERERRKRKEKKAEKKKKRRERRMAKGGSRGERMEEVVTLRGGNGAEVLVQAMHASGVEVVFANPGTTEMHIVGALDTAGVEMRSILCLHETVCTGAADGYGRMKGKPA